MGYPIIKPMQLLYVSNTLSLFMKSCFRCLCASGWTGKNCSAGVNECKVNQTFTNPCLNNGTCVDGFNNFTCACPAFYTGRLCETRYDPCDEGYDQCRNNASCRTQDDGTYKCNCTAGEKNITDI